MSSILVDITSSSADTSVTGFTEIVDLSQTVTVGSASSVLLLIATIPISQAVSADDCVDIQFAVDDVLEGPVISYFKDNVNEGCGASICWAKTGISGSHKFAVQWASRANKHADVDTGRVRSLQVIEITDANLLVNKSATSADDAVSGFTDIVDLTDTQTVAGTGSVLVLLANVTANDPSTVSTHAQRFTIAGSFEGPELTAFVDNIDECCGQSMIWMKTGISGSTAFAAQWDEIETSVEADTSRLRSFQVIEITANANLLTAKTSQAADTLTGSYTDIVDLVDTVTVDSTDSILLFASSIQQVIRSDDTGVYRFHEGSTGEGPEMYIFNDAETNEARGCGHSLYHAATGKSAGSHTFSIRGQNIQSTVNMATDRNRSLCILELLAPTGQTVAVGLVTETDLAQAIVVEKTLSLGLVTETDLAQTISIEKRRAIGLVTETDLAQPVDVEPLRRLINQALETDLAQAITVDKALSLGLVTETDLAQTISIDKTRAIGLVTEIDLAQAITVVKALTLGLVIETDLAQPVDVEPLRRLINQALETDLAQAITVDKARAIGLVLETDLAQPVDVEPLRRLINQALETDLAQAITVAGDQVVILGFTTETDLAQAIIVDKARAIGLVTETDFAQPIAVAPLRRLINQALETDLAQAIVVEKALSLGLVTETDLAQIISIDKARAIGLAIETDLAQAITAGKALTLGLATETDLAQSVTAIRRYQLGIATETDLAQIITHAKAVALGLAIELDVALALITGPPSLPGLEYSATENRLHFDALDNLLHYSSAANRLHYETLIERLQYLAMIDRIHFDIPDED